MTLWLSCQLVRSSCTKMLALDGEKKLIIYLCPVFEDAIISKHITDYGQHCEGL